MTYAELRDQVLAVAAALESPESNRATRSR